MSREFLEKHGWIRDRVIPRGMFKIVWWYHPNDGQVMMQDRAVRLQRERNRIAKGKQKSAAQA